jgi:hypothetical protein
MKRTNIFRTPAGCDNFCITIFSYYYVVSLKIMSSRFIWLDKKKICTIFISFFIFFFCVEKTFTHLSQIRYFFSLYLVLNFSKGLYQRQINVEMKSFVLFFSLLVFLWECRDVWVERAKLLIQNHVFSRMGECGWAKNKKKIKEWKKSIFLCNFFFRIPLRMCESRTISFFFTKFSAFFPRFEDSKKKKNFFFSFWY